MNSKIATAEQSGGILKRKKSLKQLFIPTRQKSQKSLRKRSISASRTTNDDALRTAVPPQHVTSPQAPIQTVEPGSESPSSRASSSIFSVESSTRPSTSRGLSKQESDFMPGTQKTIETLQSVERRPGRNRASTLTNFSKPYGLLQEHTLIQIREPARKTSHQTLRQETRASNAKPLQKAFTDGSAPGSHDRDPMESSHVKKTSLELRSEDLAPEIRHNKLNLTSNQSPQHPDRMHHVWMPRHEDLRESTQSLRSIGSSLQESKHSSTFTKVSSNTETTMDHDGMDESKDTISVNDVIDLYAELDETESQITPNTMEMNLRSQQIAEAMTAPLGSLPTPGREKSAPSTPLISAQRVRNILHEPPALQNPTATRDHYGFKKFSRDVTEESYNTWFQDYSKFQSRRNAKWQGLMSDHGNFSSRPTKFPPPSTKVQRYIRKGIPPAWRGNAWFFYAGAADLMAAQPDHYVKLVVRSQTDALNKNDREAVERDLHRTFPDNVHFKPEAAANSSQIIETPIMTALRRLLCAFAVDHPKIGYCQSLNFIAGLLLLFLPEEKAYWMLHIMTTRLLPGTHELSLEGANVDLWVLMLALKQANPGVWAKVGGDVGPSSSRLPPISLCTTSWFMSVFIGTLPIESVLRVWDVLFYEGSKTLFRIALAIFKFGESQIKSVQDPMETFQVVQSLPRKMVDVGSLFDIAFSRGEVGRRWIEKKRAERKEFYAKERAIEKARRESRDAGTRRASLSYGESLTSPATIDMASPDSAVGGEPRNNYWGRTSKEVKAET